MLNISLYNYDSENISINISLRKTNENEKTYVVDYVGSLTEFFCYILNKDIFSIYYSPNELNRLIGICKKYSQNSSDKFDEYQNLKLKYVKGNLNLKDYKNKALNIFIDEIEKINYKGLINIVDKVLNESISSGTTLERRLAYLYFNTETYIEFFDKLESELKFKPRTKISCPKLDSKLINVKNSYKLPENQKFEKLLECVKEEKLKLSTIIFYNFHTVLDLIKFLLNEMTEKNKTLKKCACCGKYFYLKRKQSTMYCENLCPKDFNKTCNQYAIYQNYLIHNKEESVKLYKKIYNVMNNRCNRTGSLTKKIELENFKKEAAGWREKIKLNSKLENDYIEWLKQKKIKFEINNSKREK